jgi:class 3 adenylate cyclase
LVAEFPAHTHFEQGQAAILAADVVGYSRLMGRDESGTLAWFRSATQRQKYLCLLKSRNR